MKAVIQRVLRASCTVNGDVTGSVGGGFLVLLGVEEGDTAEELEWLAGKIFGLRVFSDEEGQMNKSLADVNGGILLVSQFTLLASTKKGNRPSFTRAAKGIEAEKMYRQMAERLQEKTGKETQMGEFGADMKIELLNDGPVTIIIDTRKKE